MTPQEAVLRECVEARQSLTESLISRIWRNNSTPIYSDSTEARIILDALEKQTPKKPITTNKGTVTRCPNCEAIHFQCLSSVKIDYCVRCGQAIDWGDTE